MPSSESKLGAPAAARELPPVYHAVSPWRFLLFTALTAGWYPMYWSYRTWVGVRARDRSRIWPLARALFFGATSLELARELSAQREVPAPAPDLACWAAAIAFFLSGGFVPTTPPGSLWELPRALLLLPLLLRMRALVAPEVLRALDRFRPRDALLLLLGPPLWWLHLAMGVVVDDFAYLGSL